MAATLDLPEFAGRGLRDIFGGQPFPAVGENGNLTVMLGSHSFYWLRVRSASSNPSSPFTQAIPVVSTKG